MGGGDGATLHTHGHARAVMPDKFDAFSFTDSSTGHSSPVLYDGYELDLGSSIVNEVDSANAGATARQRKLPDFEDLLRMS